MRNKKTIERILITGASGFIGGSLFSRLQYFNPLGTRFNSKINLSNSNFFEIDLRDEDKVRRLINEYSPDIVFHLAALASPQVNENNPQLAIESNLHITKNIVENLSANAHMIFLSTDKVFDGSEFFPDEESNAKPQCLYGKLKLQCESIIRDRLKRFHILRLPIVHSNGDETSSSFIDKALVELKSKKRVETFNNVFRCFVRIKELLELMEVLIDDTHYGIYHVGSPMSNYYDRICVLCEENNVDWQDRLMSKAGDALPIKQNLNTEKLKKIFGYSMS